MLASRFSGFSPSVRSQTALTDDQIRRVAPSIFAEAAHESRSQRYTYIPTITVLDGLRKEGFEPFYACQTRVRVDDRRETTKHMMRLRRAGEQGARQANEVILLNSHDGTSSYQMLAGVFRFVCSNGMVCGDVVDEIRVPHKGNVVQEVIEGAFRVVDGFAQVDSAREGMQAIGLSRDAQHALAESALVLRYDEANGPAPVTPAQVLEARRFDDRADDLWTTFNRVQENLVRGGQAGRNRAGRRATTREVTGIDQGVKLNRALWVLAERMREILG
ncbi:conserved hypothetical protein; CP4-6 prophage [Thiomonas arsenitoxydans]|uniref:DUF945 domain-containing protein n=1 Tax=Thiomonas arsenitoxydans (strain DSM 22701 / CIP 110005 / 3As) TaxID=426114 RepID=D6CVT6_THIA3|nr:DUF932 domain-containing protein [Thiomonas arsenitoxydans]CAZ90425.1 conserved hypothetical protein [Thiomonas arsenitoxydans]CQR32703.1 conserved hypothetical protein; CP4-6 prophage [Thiomonas arsenitoxydans]CQR45706.1 conserved hypothetical protein; CP4-6 prophage [Thiomonas sp. CB3]